MYKFFSVLIMLALLLILGYFVSIDMGIKQTLILFGVTAGIIGAVFLSAYLWSKGE